MEGDTREVSSSRESLNWARRFSRLLAAGESGCADGEEDCDGGEACVCDCAAGGAEEDDCAKREAGTERSARADAQTASIRQKLLTLKLVLRALNI